MTLGELFEETYIQGEIAIRSYDSTGTTIEHYLGMRRSSTLTNTRKSLKGRSAISSRSWRSSRPSVSS